MYVVKAIHQIQTKMFIKDAKIPIHFFLNKNIFKIKLMLQFDM